MWYYASWPWSRDNFKGTIPGILAYLNTFWFSTAEIADEYMALTLYYSWYSRWTSLNAFTAQDAPTSIHYYCASRPVNAQRLGRACIDAGVVWALSTEVWHYNGWSILEYFDSRSFRPYNAFML